MAKEIKVPASARIVFSYYDPRILHGNSLTLRVSKTKARVYVWRGAWSVMPADEADALIAEAEAAQAQHSKEAEAARKEEEFVQSLLTVYARQEAIARRDALLASIDEAALRLTLKAKTLGERMAINDEKERLEEEVRYEFYGISGEEEFDAGEDEDEDEDEVDANEYSRMGDIELPESWIILSPNPDHNQLNLCI